MWLTGSTEPVVCGRIEQIDNSALGPVLAFTYGRSYRDTAGAISLYTPELPLQAGTFDPMRPQQTTRDPVVAASWDGRSLSLAPAYDLTPSPRHTQVSTQAIAITDDGNRASQLWVARRAATAFRMTTVHADAVIEQIVDTVRHEFDTAADAAELTQAERETLLGREILNPYAFYDTP